SAHVLRGHARARSLPPRVLGPRPRRRARSTGRAPARGIRRGLTLPVAHHRGGARRRERPRRIRGDARGDHAPRRARDRAPRLRRSRLPIAAPLRARARARRGRGPPRRAPRPPHTTFGRRPRAARRRRIRRARARRAPRRNLGRDPRDRRGRANPPRRRPRLDEARMILERISLRELKRFVEPITLDGLTPGLNLFVGPNEAGKSTIVEAIRAAFFERYRTSKATDLFPFGLSGASPTIELEMELDDGRYTLVKTFGKRAGCVLSGPTGTLHDAEAEEFLAAKLGF